MEGISLSRQSPRALFLVAFLLAWIAFSPSSKAFASQVHCGDTITQDTIVSNDLIDCPGDGLVIGADDITLDLNGHTIDGVEQRRGIAVGDGFRSGPDDVTIENGTVQQFQEGILVNGGNETHLQRLTVSDNSRQGIDVLRSSYFVSSPPGVIEQNKVTGNGGIGIAIDLAYHERVENNVVADNGAGIIGGYGSAVIKGNRVSANRHVGIGGTNFGVEIDGNVVLDNGYGAQSGLGNGIWLRGFVYFELIVHNTVAHNRDDGIALSQLDEPEVGQNNKIIDNTTADNGHHGIFLAFNAAGNLIERNTANRNGDDGIHIDRLVDPSATRNTVTQNKANKNVDLGIEATLTTIDGGGNKAHANGNPLQCLNVSCK